MEIVRMRLFFLIRDCCHHPFSGKRTEIGTAKGRSLNGSKGARSSVHFSLGNAGALMADQVGLGRRHPWRDYAWGKPVQRKNQVESSTLNKGTTQYFPSPLQANIQWCRDANISLFLPSPSAGSGFTLRLRELCA